MYRDLNLQYIRFQMYTELFQTVVLNCSPLPIVNLFLSTLLSYVR